MVRLGLGICLCLLIYYRWDLLSNEEVGRMNPQPTEILTNTHT